WIEQLRYFFFKQKTAYEIFRKKLFCFGKHRHVVYRTSETMAFVRRDYVLNGETAIAQRDYDLIRFAFVDARIVCALHDQQWRLDLIRGVQRRLAIELCLSFRTVGIAHALIENLAGGFPIRW